MKRFVSLLNIILVLSILLAACGHAPAPDSVEKEVTAVGGPEPEFMVVEVTATPVTPTITAPLVSEEGEETISDITPTPTPTLPPTLTPTPTQEDIVEQINGAIAAKGYNWEAGMTAIAGLNPEEIQMLHLTPEEMMALCREITEDNSACSSHRVTSPEEMKQSLDEGGLLAGEMIVYEDFLYYEGGVYRHAWGDQIGSHAVEIEDYDDAEGCWRIKNSWGTGWGNSWYDGEGRGYFSRLAYGEAGIEDNVYEIAYTTTPTPTVTPTLAPPTVTPTLTPMPGPAASDYAAEGLAHFEQGCRQLKEHIECTAGIRNLQQAIGSCNAAVELDPNLAAGYFCRGMSLSCLEEGLDKAAQDLERALNLGLEGDQRAQAEKELAAIKERLAARGCVSIEAVSIGEGLTADGQLIGQRPDFLAGTPDVTARWQFIASCYQDVTVKWERNYEPDCQHPAPIEEGSTWTASTSFPDEGGGFPVGDIVCASIWGAGDMIPGSKVCANFFEQPTPPPSSVAPGGAPEILSIEFPSQITADGQPFYGSVWFEDQEGDITEVRLDPISAIEFPLIAFNPMDYVVEGDSNRGRFDFNLYCTIVQDVTLRATLSDAAGNSSPPFDFNFSCQ